jgi:predicted RNase H-like nuclease (RuvC/YqgF family)
LGKDKKMTTWTTEDRMNASPPHIVDSGASVKTLGDYIEQESREEMLREQLHVLNEEIKRLTDENMKLKREIDNLMDGRC